MARNIYRLAIFIIVYTLALQLSLIADLRDGLVAYWPLDEGRGNVMGDLVAHHHGDIDKGRGTWTDDAQSGKAFNLRGQSLITVENTRDLDELADGFAIAHWMKPTKPGAIMDKSASDVARIQWYILGDLRLHWGIGNKFTFGKALPNFGKWYHVVWSHTPNKATIVYRDGQEVGNSVMGQTPATLKPMYFGNRLPWEGRSEWFNGILDEIAFWNRPLSQDEAQEVMEKGISYLLTVSPREKVATSWATIRMRSVARNP